MGWSFRKSISLGPIRFNVSKSGVGVSAGTRGFRIGKSGRGRPYVSLGAGGFRYRETLPGHATPSSGGGAGGCLVIVVMAGIGALVGAL